MENLNREVLRTQTHIGAIQYRDAEKYRELKARKDVESRAKKLFEQEFPNVVAEIKRRASNGFNESFYPLLYWSMYKTLWENTAVLKNGEAWIEGNYKFVKLNLRAIYEIWELNPLKNRKGYHDVQIRHEDIDDKYAVIVRLASRHIARELLKQGLSVAFTENDVVEKIGFKSSCGRKLPFLKISWE